MGRALLRGGCLALLVAATAAVGVAAATGSGPFPPATYPPPVASHRGALPACPNPAGLDPFDAKTTKLVVRIARSYDRTSLADDLRNSDRAWWPQVRHMWRSSRPGKGAVNQVVYGPGTPLSKSGYSVIVRFSCGQSLVARSLTVGIGPRQTRLQHCEACISHAFFLARRGRALIYYVY